MDSGKKFLKLTWAKKNLATRIVGGVMGATLALMYLLHIDSVGSAAAVTIFALGLMWVEFQTSGQEEGSGGPVGVLLATVTGGYAGILAVVWSNVIF